MSKEPQRLSVTRWERVRHPVVALTSTFVIELSSGSYEDRQRDRETVTCSMGHHRRTNQKTKDSEFNETVPSETETRTKTLAGNIQNYLYKIRSAW